MQGRRPHRWLSRPAGWVALVAILIWSVLPAGVMPYGRGDGSVTLTLCTADGPLAVVIGPDGQPSPVSPTGDDSHAKQACPWSATQFVAATAPTAVPALAGPALAARRRILPARSLRRPGRRRHRIGQPRAPPSPL